MKKEKWKIDMLVSVKVKKMAREVKELKKTVEDNVKVRNQLTKELNK